VNFNSLLEKLNIELTPKQLEQFEIYFKFLVEYNEYVNLTAITDEEDVYIKHFYDSILVGQVLDLSNVNSICDVGSGAGFPSIPLKIVYPNLKVTIVDGLDKRITFLKQLVSKLGLDNVNLVHGRAEEYAKEHRESFDIVTARAVARANILNELCITLVKVGGYFISMKGKNAEEEISEGKSLEILKGKIVKKNEYYLPKEDSKRVLILIEHFEKCPSKYPRAFASIKKNPL
jgi:16S rRNA (guanine527-N7)-methyltransferase